MATQYKTFQNAGPALDLIALTPSDTTVLDPPCRGFLISAAADGVVSIRTVGGDIRTFTGGVFAGGVIHPVVFDKLLAATTAAVYGVR